MLNKDFRHFNNGYLIPTEEGGYADQPSLALLPDGTILCAVTTGTGGEGAAGEYVSVLRSADGGVSWEMATPPEDKDKDSSYGVLVVDGEGCVYCIYNYNLEGYRPNDCGIARIDMGGHICMRYTTDAAKTWSERIEVPIAITDMDRLYPCHTNDGKVYRFFWNVARPFFDGDDLYLTMAKPYSAWLEKGNWKGLADASHSVLLRARGLAKNKNAAFETLPAGGKELLPLPGDGVLEEPCCVKLSDGTLFIICRSENGHPVIFHSRDGGESFTEGELPTHEGGAPLKHPRAANFIWKFPEGRYLYWFHNIKNVGYEYRNPAWCCPCFETDTPHGKTLTFGQPEILLFHESALKTVSYPDLILRDGHFLLSETEKQEARLHPLPDEFMETVFSQNTICKRQCGIPMETLVKEGIPRQVFATTNHTQREDWMAVTGKGCSWIFEGRFAAGDTVLSAENRQTGGYTVTVTKEGRVRAEASSRTCRFAIESTIPVADGKPHHIAWVLDTAAHVSFLVIDGRFDNGTEVADCGWVFIPLQMIEVGKVTEVTFGKGVTRAELIERALLTTEAVGDRRASEAK